MADTPILIKPGVSLVKSAMLNQSAISNCNLIRYYDGLLQKKGGWTQLTNLLLQGTCRGMHGFADLQSNTYVAAGTEQLLQLYSPQIPSEPISSIVTGQPAIIPEITPVVSTSNLSGPFSTIANTNIVTVLDPASVSVGSWIYIATLTYVDGILLQGLYQVASVLTGGYTFLAPSKALAGVTGGGTTLTIRGFSGSATADISLGAFAFATGETILVYDVTTIGGVAISGNFHVTVTGGVATINMGSASASNATVTENGGEVQILYLLPPFTTVVAESAFGSGPFGSGPFGTGQSQVQPASQREWSIDNFGQILAANPKGVGLYAWTPPYTYNNRATLVGNDAPQFSQGIFVAMPEEQIVSFGSDGGGFQDPMLVRWSTAGSFQNAGNWTASTSNQAGSFRLSRGSAIVGGLWTEFGGLLFTDVGLWLMTYIQPPFIYSFNEISKGCGLISLRAAAEVGGIVVWPSSDSFFMFNGYSVVPLPCEVWDYFYENLDKQYVSSIAAFPNSNFNEIAWHFPPVGANGVPTNYVSLNVAMLAAGLPPAQCWDFGTLTRTAAIDRSAAGFPTGADGTNGFLQEHETQTDANGASMPSFAETGWFRVAEGRQYMFVERLFPDFVFGPGGGQVNVSVLVGEYVGDGTIGLIRTYGPFACTPSTQHVIPRCRGRLMQLKFDFSPLGSFARLGEIEARMAPAGSR